MNAARRVSGFWLPTLAGACASGALLSAGAQTETYRYRQAGSGRPVVVFENGLGATLETWRAVQDDVSEFTETFSYNRAGYGGSPPAVGTRDAATVVGELRALLAARGLEPPYLLVGHSLGGLYMQYYARNFPAEVNGLVLVDSTHWDQFERLQSVAPTASSSVGMTGVGREEFTAMEASCRQVRDSPSLQPMPLIVLSAGQPSGSRMPRSAVARAAPRVPAEFWDEMQRELAAQLPGARHTIAERSDHFIQERQPQYVWASVRDIVLALRAR